MPGPFSGINTNIAGGAYVPPPEAPPRQGPQGGTMVNPRFQAFLDAGYSQAEALAMLQRKVPEIFTLEDAQKGLSLGKTPAQIRTDARNNGMEISGPAEARLQQAEEPAAGAAGGTPSFDRGPQYDLGNGVKLYWDQLTDTMKNALGGLGGGSGGPVGPQPQPGISWEEANAQADALRARGYTVGITRNNYGGYNVEATIAPPAPPPPRTGFGTPEEAYGATPAGLTLGQLTGTPTTGFMPTYVDRNPSPFEQQQFADKQAQDAITNELSKSQMRLNAYINMGNQQAAAQEANYKSKLEIRAQALAERTASYAPMVEMGNATGYYPARAIMAAATTPLPEMPAPLDIQVPRTEQILAAAGIPLSAIPSIGAPGASVTLPPVSATEAGRLALAARLFRGMS